MATTFTFVSMSGVSFKQGRPVGSRKKRLVVPMMSGSAASIDQVAFAQVQDSEPEWTMPEGYAASDTY